MTRWILVQANPASPADWVLFWGHFHPLIVHLPIGFLLIAGLLELDRLTRRNSVSQHTITLILFWSAVSATMACIAGYMLSLGGGYEPDTLKAHQWQGIGVAIFAWLAWAVKSEHVGRFGSFAPFLYLPTLSISLLLLLSAGHLGGNLTHGSDYLTQYLPGSLRTLAGLPAKQPQVAIRPITDVQQALVYQQIINPILQSRCVQCHNAAKSKAGLRLDAPDWLKKGAEDGPVFVAGKARDSDLVKVCLLPDDDDNHMPPKGKPQLQPDQITLLTWWIDQGAPFEKKVADLRVTAPVRPLLAALEGHDSSQAHPVAANSTSSEAAPIAAVLTRRVPAANATVVDALKKTGLLVLPLSKDQNQLEVSAVNAHAFNDTQAQLLPTLSEQLVWLKLSDTQITDAALAPVSKLKNLQKLHLEQTNITDAGLVQLKGLANLEYLNLYGTGVTDAGLPELTTLKQLKSLYLWHTKVTEKGVAQLKKALPTLEINDGITEASIAAFAKIPVVDDKAGGVKQAK